MTAGSNMKVSQEEDVYGEVRFWNQMLVWYEKYQGKKPPQRMYQALELALEKVNAVTAAQQRKFDS